MVVKAGHYIFSCIGSVLFYLPAMIAQVPVSEEPFHHNVLQNKYIRLLDVWLQPGDTSQYHIHAIPSLFVYLSNTTISSQIKGKEWVREQASAGKFWYRSFTPDTLVHRVCNSDTVPLHVTDIELLSPYGIKNLAEKSPVPFPVLFENEKVMAWRMTKANFTGQIIRDRGPMIAELASGHPLIFHDVTSNKSKKMNPGDYLYIEPGSSFYFAAEGTGEIDMVLFELK